MVEYHCTFLCFSIGRLSTYYLANICYYFSTFHDVVIAGGATSVLYSVAGVMKQLGCPFLPKIQTWLSLLSLFRSIISVLCQPKNLFSTTVV